MIQLYTSTTPNGRKVSIYLEEAEIPYQVHALNLRENEQLRPEFLAINPNNKIPAIIDEDAPGGPFTVIESGAILQYLAEKTGKFLSTNPRERSEAAQWLMFQMSAVGPMFGQLNHFANAAPEKLPYAIERFQKEVGRILRVLNQRLTDREFLAGQYSIADIATYPWVAPLFSKIAPLAGVEVPGLARWVEVLSARPAVQRGMKVP
jgi:GST-like protein